MKAKRYVFAVVILATVFSLCFFAGILTQNEAFAVSEITIKADNVRINVGENVPELSYTVIGTEDEEILRTIDENIMLSSNYTDNPGVYSIYVGFKDGKTASDIVEGYTLGTVDGVFTVCKVLTDGVCTVEGLDPAYDYQLKANSVPPFDGDGVPYASSYDVAYKVELYKITNGEKVNYDNIVTMKLAIPERTDVRYFSFGRVNNDIRFSMKYPGDYDIKNGTVVVDTILPNLFVFHNKLGQITVKPVDVTINEGEDEPNYELSITGYSDLDEELSNELKDKVGKSIRCECAYEKGRTGDFAVFPEIFESGKTEYTLCDGYKIILESGLLTVKPFKIKNKGGAVAVEAVAENGITFDNDLYISATVSYDGYGITDKYKTEITPYVNKADEAIAVYSIKLMRDTLDGEIEVQPAEIAEGLFMKVTFTVPDEAKGKSFKVIHIGDAESGTKFADFTMNGDKITIRTDRLSDFVFVLVGMKETTSLTTHNCLGWVLLVLDAVTVLLITAVFLLRAKFGSSKIMRIGSLCYAVGFLASAITVLALHVCVNTITAFCLSVVLTVVIVWATIPDIKKIKK